MSGRVMARRMPFVDAWVWLVVIVTLLPFAWLVVMSFKTSSDIFIPKFFFRPTLDNYRALLTPEFMGSFLNSAITSVVSTALGLLFGVPGAYALARAPHGRSQGISMLILVSRMAPPIAFTIPYFLLYRRIGLLDTRTGLILIYLTFNLSLVIWLMRGFFEAIPREIEEAAWMDGASLWKTFVVIVLPLCGPALITTAILCFLYSWNDFFFALILTRSHASTAPVQVVNFMNYEGWQWGKIAAGGTLIMLPVLAFSLLMRRFLVSGMTAGAVKQ